MLGIAQELASCNPPLLELLQQQCETRIIRSGQFHDVFLHEYGSQDQPLPTHYYVPGDGCGSATRTSVIGYHRI